MKTLTKHKNYTNTTDTYLVYTFTGKTRKARNYTEAEKSYQFIESPKEKNNTWLKPKTTWKSESFVNDYFTENK